MVNKTPFVIQKKIFDDINETPTTIFDLGANVGDVTQEYGSVFPNAKIICFEPIPSSFESLKKRFTGNDSIQCFPFAVGENENDVDIFETFLSGNSSLLKPSTYVTKSLDKEMAESVVIKKSHQVKQITLDSFCKKNKISHINILKMDIQGSELHALEGAMSLLEDNKIDLIYVEVTFTTIYENQSNYFDIASFLHKKKYELFDFVYLVRGLDGKIYRGDVIFLSPRLLKNFQVFPGASIPIDDKLEQKDQIISQAQKQLEEQGASYKTNIEMLTASHKEHIEKLNASHKEHIETLDTSHKEQIQERDKVNSQLHSQIDQLKIRHESELEFEQNRIKEIYNSKTWRLGQLYGRKLGGNILGRLGERLVNYLIKSKPQTNTNPEKKLNELQKILLNHKQVKGIIIYPPTVDWNIPLLQRPQHMALHLATSGWLYFYCTSNIYDKVNGYKKLNDNLYLTDRYDDLINNLEKFVIVIHSGHPTFTISEIEKFRNKSIIVYDYLDDIHPSIGGLQIQKVFDRHKYLINNSEIILATADKLFFEVKESRKENVILLSNAVDYDHFHLQRKLAEMPHEIKKIKGNKEKLIVGYFGALASWVDYDLIRHIATEKKDLEFVLIGWDYDGSLEKSGILNIKNIHYLGVKPYQKLPSYAIWFDLCMLPFSLNSITHATSPIKLFEYMALGRPIISTPINEALKYKSVIIANDKDEFIEKINAALQLKDDTTYLDLLDKEARENTWEIRFGHLDRVLQDSIMKKDWYRDEGWMREIIKTQDELAGMVYDKDLDPNPYYLSAYKEAENHFWLHIPKWIYEDNEKDKVIRCLDIGTGYGTLALFCKRLFNCDIYCIDNKPYLNRTLIKKYKFKFKVNNIELEPFPWCDIKFDIILFTEVLEHFNFNPIPTLKKIHDLLSDNGRLYLSTPDALQWGKMTKYYPGWENMPYPNQGLPVIDDHVYQFNQKELLEVLDEAGFRVVRFDYSPGVVARHFNMTLMKK